MSPAQTGQVYTHQTSRKDTTMTTTITAPVGRDYRLGHDISQTRSLDQALETSGLDWGLNILPANGLWVIQGDDMVQTSIPGQRLVMRDDNHVTLGVVGSKYHQVNNRSVFGLATQLTSQGARPERAGELDHGRRVFMDFDLPGNSVSLAGGQDLVKFGARLKAAHDGSGKVVAEIFGQRLWCMNGCTTAIKGIPHVFSVSHTASAERQMREAAIVMAGASRYVAAFTGAAERMLNTPMSLVDFTAYIDALFPEPAADAGKRERTIWETRKGELLTLFRFAETNQIGRGTRWGAFNSVTEHLDWGTSVRQGAASDLAEARARRQFDNANQSVRDQAFAFALAA